MQERKYKIEDHKLVKRSDGVPIPDDEPLFILRGKDRKALGCLMAYQAVCDNIDHKASIQRTIEDFRSFQAAYPERMKEPDTPAEY